MNNHNDTYIIQHYPKKGGISIVETDDFNEMKSYFMSLYKKRLTTVVYKNGVIVGCIRKQGILHPYWYYNLEH